MPYVVVYLQSLNRLQINGTACRGDIMDKPIYLPLVFSQNRNDHSATPYRGPLIGGHASLRDSSHDSLDGTSELIPFPVDLSSNSLQLLACIIPQLAPLRDDPADRILERFHTPYVRSDLSQSRGLTICRLSDEEIP